MTINGIGSGAPAFSGELGMDMEGRFALLVLEHEETQQVSDHASKQLAREQFVAASDDQVQALRDEADDIRLGALVQGAATLTAASIKIGDQLMEPKCDPMTGLTPKEKPWGEISAAVFDGSAPVLGKYLSDAPVADDRANGKQAATAAQLAEWQRNDSQEAIGRSDKRQDKATDWLATTSSNQASTTQAIIAGIA